jgi:hypothetical protein
VPAFIDVLERQARLAVVAESDYRIQVHDRLKQLEASRVAAHRRLSLLRGMAEAIRGAADAAAADAAGIEHACARTGWSAADAAGADVRARLAPVAAAVREAAGPGAADRPAAAAQAPILAFAAFEAWYRARFAVDFLSLMDSDVGAFGPAVAF